MAAMSKGNIEKVTGTPKTRAEWEQSINQAILDFYYSTYGLETVAEIAKLPHNAFLAALEYCKRNCVSRFDLMEVSPHKIHETKGGLAYNEQYSPERVGDLCEVYLNVCALYDKVPSVYCFSVLSGIDRTVLQNWVSESQKGVSIASRYNTPKRAVSNIKAARAQSLENVALSGGKGTIGAIAFLNNELWKDSNLPTDTSKKPLSVLDLPIYNPETGALEIPREGAALSARPDPVALPDLGAELPTFEVSADGLPILGGD